MNSRYDDCFNGLNFECAHRSLLAVVRMKLGPRHLAAYPPEDLAQETYLKAWSAKDQFRGTTPAELHSWLRRILTRLIADVYAEIALQEKRLGPGISLFDVLDESENKIIDLLSATGTAPSSVLRREERDYFVADAIESLPPNQRDAVIIRYFHDWPIAEIAAFMGKTTAAVAMLLQHGLSKLKTPLEKRA